MAKASPATRSPATRKARVELTPGQKAARTKRRLGLDLSEIANRAAATRLKNARRAKREATIAARAKTAKREARASA